MPLPILPWWRALDLCDTNCSVKPGLCEGYSSRFSQCCPILHPVLLMPNSAPSSLVQSFPQRSAGLPYWSLLKCVRSNNSNTNQEKGSNYIYDISLICCLKDDIHAKYNCGRYYAPRTNRRWKTLTKSQVHRVTHISPSHVLLLCHHHWT